MSLLEQGIFLHTARTAGLSSSETRGGPSEQDLQMVQ